MIKGHVLRAAVQELGMVVMEGWLRMVVVVLLRGVLLLPLMAMPLLAVHVVVVLLLLRGVPLLDVHVRGTLPRLRQEQEQELGREGAGLHQLQL